MTTVEITIGWTMSDLPEYSSFADGYRPGARQHTETIRVTLDLTGLTVGLGGRVQAIAERVFDATNNPASDDDLGPISRQIRQAIAATGYHGQGAHYSLSTGDTVTIGEVMLACESIGWSRVSPLALEGEQQA